MKDVIISFFVYSLFVLRMIKCLCVPIWFKIHTGSSFRDFALSISWFHFSVTTSIIFFYSYYKLLSVLQFYLKSFRCSGRLIISNNVAACSSKSSSCIIVRDSTFSSSIPRQWQQTLHYSRASCVLCKYDNLITKAWVRDRKLSEIIVRWITVNCPTFAY